MSFIGKGVAHQTYIAIRAKNAALTLAARYLEIEHLKVLLLQRQLEINKE